MIIELNSTIKINLFKIRILKWVVNPGAWITLHAFLESSEDMVSPRRKNI